MKFVLASKSPRRKELLSLFDLRLIITSHLFDESSISTEIPPKEYCEFHIKEYINYCTKCNQLMSSNQFEYKNDKFGYLDKKYCKLNK